MRTWRAFLVAHSAVQRRMEADLETAHQLPLAWYDVLVQLAEAPGQALRMSELAARVLLSRSGLTRLVDRLEREGLVARRACPDDARGTLAELTPAGLDRLRVAAPVHLAGIGRYVTDRFTPAELETLGTLLERIAPTGLPAPASPHGADPPHEPADTCGADLPGAVGAGGPATSCGADLPAAVGAGRPATTCGADLPTTTCGADLPTEQPA